MHYSQYLKAKISPLFVILIIITFAIFAFVMINISLLPTPEQKQAEYEQYTKDVALKEESLATGKTIEELKGQKKRALNQREIVHNINQAVLRRDITGLKELLLKLKVDPENSTALVSAVSVRDMEVFRILLAANFPCNNVTNAGSRAFGASIGSENPEFLKMLLEKNCIYTEQNNQKSIGERIVRSKFPIKIFQLSDPDLVEKFGGQALQKTIKKRKSEQALAMIELGANVSKTKLIELSLRNSMPKVALSLIKTGTIIEDVKSKTQFPVLVNSIKQGYIEVFQEILERDPDYITRNKLEDSVFSASLLIKDQVKRRKSLSLALSYGVNPESLKDKGSYGLLQAIFYQDDIIVEQLLKAGVNPNRLVNHELALIVAKNINSPRYKQFRKINQSKQSNSIDTENRIISLLEQQGASDNFFKAVMQTKGIKTIKSCSLGKVISVEFEATNNILSQRTARNNFKQCINATSICINQGFGADDCMRTVPSCDNEDRTVLCCNNTIKEQYFKGRCSGLLVNESIQLLRAEFNH